MHSIRTTHFLAGILLISLFSLLLPELCRAGESLSFGMTDLRVEGVVTGVLPGDFNGDGRADLLVLHTSGDALHLNHHFSVFYQWEDGSFSTAADRSWIADSLAQAVALEAVEPGVASDILYLRKDGVFRHSFREGAISERGELLIDHATLFVSSESERLMPVPAISELDENGDSWITLPHLEGVVLYRRSAAGSYDPVDSVAYRPKSRILSRLNSFESDRTMNIRQVLSIPQVAAGSLGSRGARDIILLYSEKMEGFFNSERGFSPRPDMVLDYDLAASTPRERGMDRIQPTIRDLDGDGSSDLIITKQEGEGLSGFRTTLDILFGPLAGGAQSRPSQRIVFDDTFSYAISFEDIDSDGDLEMAVPTIKVGVFDLIRILTTQSLKVKINIYEIGDGGIYLEEPRYIHEIKASLDLGGGGTGEVVGKAINANGDGLKDLIVSLEPEKLSIFLGKGGGSRFFERDPEAHLPAYKGVEIETADLTGNGLDDLIATFGTSSDGVGIIRLYINRNDTE